MTATTHRYGVTEPASAHPASPEHVHLNDSVTAPGRVLLTCASCCVYLDTDR